MGKDEIQGIASESMRFMCYGFSASRFTMVVNLIGRSREVFDGSCTVYYEAMVGINRIYIR